MFIESIDKLVNYLMKRSATDLVPIDELVESKIVGKKIPTEDEFFNFPKVKLPEDKFALAKRIDFREDFSPLQMNVNHMSYIYKIEISHEKPHWLIYKYYF